MIIFRKKLVPQTIFTPTKHPHASSTRLDSIDNSNNSKQQNESPFSRSIFSGSKTRNTNSASQSGNQRKSGHISVYEYNNVGAFYSNWFLLTDHKL